MTPSDMFSFRDSANKGGVNAPILWALLALAYLFEIGAVAVVINAPENLQIWAGISAMVFPIIIMVGVIVIRTQWEHLFYISREQLEQSTMDYSSENVRKTLASPSLASSWAKGAETAKKIDKEEKS